MKATEKQIKTIKKLNKQIAQFTGEDVNKGNYSSLTIADADRIIKDQIEELKELESDALGVVIPNSK